jgi:hypothetical protein
VNRRVVEGETTRVLVHAAAAEADGGAVILPGESEAGKTTTVAGLVRSGLRYLTDEAVAVGIDPLVVEPYPKPLSVEPGARPVLSGLRPALDGPLRRYAGAQWHVAPADIRPGAVGRPSVPRLVVVPRYRAGGPTRLVPLPRSEALLLLVTSSFNLAVVGPPGFGALAEVVRRSGCYRLDIADLGEAVALVRRLLA